jgi:hypothetical protein
LCPRTQADEESLPRKREVDDFLRFGRPTLSHYGKLSEFEQLSALIEIAGPENIKNLHLGDVNLSTVETSYVDNDGFSRPILDPWGVNAQHSIDNHFRHLVVMCPNLEYVSGVITFDAPCMAALESCPKLKGIYMNGGIGRMNDFDSTKFVDFIKTMKDLESLSVMGCGFQSPSSSFFEKAAEFRGKLISSVETINPKLKFEVE